MPLASHTRGVLVRKDEPPGTLRPESRLAIHDGHLAVAPQADKPAVQTLSGHVIIPADALNSWFGQDCRSARLPGGIPDAPELRGCQGLNLVSAASHWDAPGGRLAPC